MYQEMSMDYWLIQAQAAPVRLTKGKEKVIASERVRGVRYSPQSVFPLQRFRLRSMGGRTFSAGIVKAGPGFEQPWYQ